MKYINQRIEKKVISSICILGGGTAGFATAAILSQHFKDLKIKCVYSSQIGRIGVGESTQLAINDIFQFLRLSDKEWMPKCNATYKTSIAFKNFREGKGERFQYPFGNFDLYHDYKGTPITFFELQAKYGKE